LKRLNIKKKISRKKIALFFNNNRGLEVFKKIKKDNDVDIFLSKKNLNKSIVKKLRKSKISFQIIEKINNNVINLIKNKKYYLLISAGWPLIFNQKVLNASIKEPINLHAGRLPNYRGGSPINWQIINGEKYIVINVIKMTLKVDHGPIYTKKKIKILNSDDVLRVHNKVNSAFPKLVIEAIGKIQNNQKPIKQSSKNAQTYKQRSDKDGLIEWKKMNSTQVYNFIRAITKPYPGAFYYDKNKIIRIYKSKISNLKRKCDPGTFFKIKGKTYVRCKKGFIQIIQKK